MIIISATGEAFKFERAATVSGGAAAAVVRLVRTHLERESNEEEAVVFVDMSEGLFRASETIEHFLDSGVRYLSVAAFYPENASMFHDSEIKELVQFELEENLGLYGFADGVPPIYHVPESASSSATVLFNTLVSAGFRERKPAALIVNHGSETLSEVVERALSKESLELIRDARGRRVSGPDKAMAAEIDNGVWWAPNFQFRQGTRNVDDTVSEIWVLLRGSEDPAGALSWWLYPNPWLEGLPPSDLVGSGRDAQLRFAAAQAIGGDW